MLLFERSNKKGRLDKQGRTDLADGNIVLGSVGVELLMPLFQETILYARPEKWTTFSQGLGS